MNPSALAWALVVGNEARATDEIIQEIREMTAQAEIDALLDAYFPPCGLCLCCGQDDARHRVIDAIASRWWAGDSVADLMADYELPKVAVYLAIGVYSDALRGEVE